MIVDGFTPRPSFWARSPFTRRDRSFWSAFAEPIRDQSSPTDFCNITIDVRATKPELLILAGTEASTSFLFFTMSRLLPCGSGDMWRAALRPSVKAPVLVIPGYPGLPNRDALSFAPPPQLAPWCVVRINVHGPPDRVKDASPSECTISRASLGACALWRMLTTFPSSAPFGHPRSSARLLAVGDTTTRERTDQDPRSDGTPRRAPPSRRSGCLSPPRHAKELVSREGIAPFGLRAGSLAHAAHTLTPSWGQCSWWALRGHGAVTRGSVAVREYRCFFYSLGLPRLGLTTQARHRARLARPSTRTDCLARTDASRSA